MYFDVFGLEQLEYDNLAQELHDIFEEYYDQEDYLDNNEEDQVSEHQEDEVLDDEDPKIDVFTRGNHRGCEHAFAPKKRTEGFFNS